MIDLTGAMDVYLTIIPRARMGSESIAHEAEGRMGYTPMSLKWLPLGGGMGRARERGILG